MIMVEYLKSVNIDTCQRRYLSWSVRVTELGSLVVDGNQFLLPLARGLDRKLSAAVDEFSLMFCFFYHFLATECIRFLFLGVQCVGKCKMGNQQSLCNSFSSSLSKSSSCCCHCSFIAGCNGIVNHMHALNLSYFKI